MYKNQKNTEKLNKGKDSCAYNPKKETVKKKSK
jgi:hypothetical protein